MKKSTDGYSHFKQVQIIGDVSEAGNGVQIAPAATSANPAITAIGDDDNVSLNLVPKGTGAVQVAGVPVVTTTGTQALTGKTVDGRGLAVFTLAGAAIHAGVVTAWAAPAASIIERVIADITTKSTGASTLDVGYTAVSATTASDTLLDGVDSGTAAAVFDSMNAALDSGANALAQKAASGKWITVKEGSGDTTGLAGKLYIYYTLCA